MSDKRRGAKKQGGTSERTPGRSKTAGRGKTAGRRAGARGSEPRQGRASDRGRTGNSSWDPVASWYDSTIGVRGSPHHRKAAVPTVMAMADLKPGEALIDVGCGQGVLAHHVLKSGADYLGVDASEAMIRLARKRRGDEGRFEHGDARDLVGTTSARAGAFEVAVFLLSLQDMDPLEDVLASAAKVLKPAGRLVIFMVHPAFRAPRGSGWGYDERRKLVYRRVERYLGRSAVPMKSYAEAGAGPRGATISFHRPLQDYVTALAANGLLVDAMVELPDPVKANDERGDSSEIPLFVALRARNC